MVHLRQWLRSGNRGEGGADDPRIAWPGYPPGILWLPYFGIQTRRMMRDPPVTFNKMEPIL